MHPLQQPRLLVTGPYPFSPYEVGEVIDIVDDEQFLEGCGLPNGDYTILKAKTLLADYPNLFRLCEWWEFRKESEMPEYVKFNGNFGEYKIGQVYKALRYGQFYDFETIANKTNNKYAIISTSDNPKQFNLMLLDPATETEYNNYVNTTHP